MLRTPEESGPAVAAARLQGGFDGYVLGFDGTGFEN